MNKLETRENLFITFTAVFILFHIIIFIVSANFMIFSVKYFYNTADQLQNASVNNFEELYKKTEDRIEFLHDLNSEYLEKFYNTNASEIISFLESNSGGLDIKQIKLLDSGSEKIDAENTVNTAVYGCIVQGEYTKTAEFIYKIEKTFRTCRITQINIKRDRKRVECKFIMSFSYKS